MKSFDQLVEEMTSPKFDDLINQMLDDKEDHQILQEILAVKECFTKAYEIANGSMDKGVPLEDWEKYQTAVIDRHLDQFIGKSPEDIASDFENYSRELNKYQEPNQRDYQDQGF